VTTIAAEIEMKLDFLNRLVDVIYVQYARYQQFRMNIENENMAMSCGTYNPRFLAKIKRSKPGKC
jgi:hypothetical protein